jgi:hypothetical protein
MERIDLRRRKHPRPVRRARSRRPLHRVRSSSERHCLKPASTLDAGQHAHRACPTHHHRKIPPSTPSPSSAPASPRPGAPCSPPPFPLGGSGAERAGQRGRGGPQTGATRAMRRAGGSARRVGMHSACRLPPRVSPAQPPGCPPGSAPGRRLTRGRPGLPSRACVQERHRARGRPDSHRQGKSQDLDRTARYVQILLLDFPPLIKRRAAVAPPWRHPTSEPACLPDSIPCASST